MVLVFYHRRNPFFLGKFALEITYIWLTLEVVHLSLVKVSV